MNQTSTTQGATTPRLINWLGYLAITLLLVLPLAVFTVRSGAWQQGLLMYAIACLGSAILLLLAFVLLLLPRFANWRKAIAGRVFFAVPGSLLMLSLLGASNYPPIHDISTDLQDPPVFMAAAEQRGDGSNSLEIDSETLAQQARGYPELATLVMQRPYDYVYEKAVKTATEMGWNIYQQDYNSGVIEAVDTTAVMHFKDDIVIRLRTNNDGVLIDLRSVSRVGLGDMGANAARINAFLERMAQE